MDGNFLIQPLTNIFGLVVLCQRLDTQSLSITHYLRQEWGKEKGERSDPTRGWVSPTNLVHLFWFPERERVK